eukprot:XP_001705420.1 Hypothetical protein GL50803_36565 [Giardia lamblia ATCC 50803]
MQPEEQGLAHDHYMWKVLKTPRLGPLQLTVEDTIHQKGPSQRYLCSLHSGWLAPCKEPPGSQPSVVAPG